MAPVFSFGQAALVMQWSSTMSSRSVPISDRKRSRSAHISASVFAWVLVRMTTITSFQGTSRLVSTAPVENVARLASRP
jgi:hypothetical protein